MDKALIRRRFSKAAATYAERADVQREIARRMARLVRTYVPVSERKKVVEVGCGTGTFTRDFLRHERPERMWLNDLCPEMEVPLKDVLRENVSFLPGMRKRWISPTVRICSCLVRPFSGLSIPRSFL